MFQIFIDFRSVFRPWFLFLWIFGDAFPVIIFLIMSVVWKQCDSRQNVSRSLPLAGGLHVSRQTVPDCVRPGLAEIPWDGYKKLSCLACATWNSRNPSEFSCKNERNCSITSARFPPTHRCWYFFGMESSSYCPGSSQSTRWFYMQRPLCSQYWWWHPTSGIKNGCALRHQLACLFSACRCWFICFVS